MVIAITNAHIILAGTVVLAVESVLCAPFTPVAPVRLRLDVGTPDNQSEQQQPQDRCSKGPEGPKLIKNLSQQWSVVDNEVNECTPHRDEFTNDGVDVSNRDEYHESTEEHCKEKQWQNNNPQFKH